MKTFTTIITVIMLFLLLGTLKAGIYQTLGDKNTYHLVQE